MISRDDFLKGRDKAYAAEFTPEISAECDRTIAAANLAVTLYLTDNPDAEHPHCNSGWRPREINKTTPGAAPMSRHMRGQAIDLGDTADRRFAIWCLKNRERLKSCGIYAMERPEACVLVDAKGNKVFWVHLQTVTPGSGVFVFWPTDAALLAWQKSGEPLLVG